MSRQLSVLFCLHFVNTFLTLLKKGRINGRGWVPDNVRLRFFCQFLVLLFHFADTEHSGNQLMEFHSSVRNHPVKSHGKKYTAVKLFHFAADTDKITGNDLKQTHLR